MGEGVEGGRGDGVQDEAVVENIVCLFQCRALTPGDENPQPLWDLPESPVLHHRLENLLLSFRQHLVVVFLRLCRRFDSSTYAISLAPRQAPNRSPAALRFNRHPQLPRNHALLVIEVKLMLRQSLVTTFRISFDGV